MCVSSLARSRHLHSVFVSSHFAVTSVTRASANRRSSCQDPAGAINSRFSQGGIVKTLAIILLALCFCLPSVAQYTDLAAVNDLGGPQEFARRRDELARQLKTGVLILFARVN